MRSKSVERLSVTNEFALLGGLGGHRAGRQKAERNHTTAMLQGCGRTSQRSLYPRKMPPYTTGHDRICFSRLFLKKSPSHGVLNSVPVKKQPSKLLNSLGDIFLSLTFIFFDFAILERFFDIFNHNTIYLKKDKKKSL